MRLVDEEYVEIEVRKLEEDEWVGEDEWVFSLKATIPPFDSEAVRKLNEAFGDISGDVKIDADGLVIGRIVGSIDQVLDRLGKAVFKVEEGGGKRVEEARGKFIKAVEKVQSPLPVPALIPALIGPAGHLAWLKARAKAIKPYPRLNGAWVQEGYKALDLLKKKHAVIRSVRFGACGYQDAAYGLTIELKGEDGWQSQWSFFSMEDIYELMHRTRTSSLRALAGKPMFVYVLGSFGSTVVGVDVNDALIL